MVGQGTSLDIRANPDMFDDVRQNKWNDALFRFGWKSMLGWSYKRNGKVYYPNHIKKNLGQIQLIHSVRFTIHVLIKIVILLSALRKMFGPQS